MAAREKAQCRFCRTFEATGKTVEEAFTKLGIHVAQVHPEEAEKIRHQDTPGKSSDEFKLY